MISTITHSFNIYNINKKKPFSIKKTSLLGEYKIEIKELSRQNSLISTYIQIRINNSLKIFCKSNTIFYFLKFFKAFLSESVKLVLRSRFSVLDLRNCVYRNFFLILTINFRKRPETPITDRSDLRLVLYEGGQKRSFQKLFNFLTFFWIKLP